MSGVAVGLDALCCLDQLGMVLPGSPARCQGLPSFPLQAAAQRLLPSVAGPSLSLSLKGASAVFISEVPKLILHGLNAVSSPPLSPHPPLACTLSLCHWKYLHALLSIMIVKLHVAARLNPAYNPGLFLGDRRYQHLGRGSEVGRPVPQNHAGRLVDVGGDGVDGGFDFDHRNAFPENFGFAANALNTAHGIQRVYNP